MCVGAWQDMGSEPGDKAQIKKNVATIGEWLPLIDTLSKCIFMGIGNQDFTLGEWTFTHSKPSKDTVLGYFSDLVGAPTPCAGPPQLPPKSPSLISIYNLPFLSQPSSPFSMHQGEDLGTWDNPAMPTVSGFWKEPCTTLVFQALS